MYYFSAATTNVEILPATVDIDIDILLQELPMKPHPHYLNQQL